MGRYTVEYGDKIFDGKSVNHKGYIREDSKFKCTTCDFTNQKMAGMRQHVTKIHGCMFCVNNPNSTHDHGEKDKRKTTTYIKKVKRKPKGFGKKGLAMKKAAAEEAARLGIDPEVLLKQKMKRKRREYKKRNVKKKVPAVPVSIEAPKVLLDEPEIQEIPVISENYKSRKEGNSMTDQAVADRIDLNNNHIVVEENGNCKASMENDIDTNSTFQIEDEIGNLIFIKLDTNRYVDGTRENERANQIQNIILQLNHYQSEHNKLKIRVGKTEALLYQSKKDLGNALATAENLRRQNHNLYEKYQIEVSALIETQEQNKKLEEMNQRNTRYLAKLLNERERLVNKTNAVQNMVNAKISPSLHGSINNGHNKGYSQLILDEALESIEKNQNFQAMNIPNVQTIPLYMPSEQEKRQGNDIVPFSSRDPPLLPTKSNPTKKPYSRAQSSVCSIPGAPLDKLKIDDDLADWADQLIK